VDYEIGKKDLFSKFRRAYSTILDKWDLTEKKNEILKYSPIKKLEEMDLCLNIKNAKCSICRLMVKGLCIQCFICGHGGHIVHLKDWFRKSQQCASGCGCLCVFE
jgi:WD repeat-containing protein 59